MVAPQSGRDRSQCALVHIEYAAPGHLAGIDVQLVVPVHVIVDECRQQVVCRADGVKVPCEMQVDIGHRDDLRVTASGRAALHAETGPETRFAKTHDRVFADRIQAVPETDRGGRFAFAGGRRRNRGHEDQFAVLPVVQTFQKVVADLGLVVAERNNVIRRQTKFRRNVTDGFFVRSLCDFDVRRYLAHILDLHGWLSRASTS